MAICVCVQVFVLVCTCLYAICMNKYVCVHVCMYMLYMCFIHVCIICTCMPCMHVYVYVKEECNLDMVRALSALDAAPLSQTSFREEVGVGRGKLSNCNDMQLSSTLAPLLLHVL